MASAEIDGIGGLDAISAALHAKAARIGPQADRVLRSSARRLEATAKVLAPVDTGALRGSISTDVSGSAVGAGIEAEIGPTVLWGKFQEHGTSRMRPQPYLGPALDREGPRMEGAAAAIADPFD